MEHRVFSDGHELPRRDARYSRRRSGPDLPTSRERDRTVGVDQRQAFRPVLASLGALAYRIAEDVEVARELLYSSGPARSRAPARGDPIPAGFCSLSKEAQLYVRRREGRG